MPTGHYAYPPQPAFNSATERSAVCKFDDFGDVVINYSYQLYHTSGVGYDWYPTLLRRFIYKSLLPTTEKIPAYRPRHDSDKAPGAFPEKLVTPSAASALAPRVKIARLSIRCASIGSRAADMRHSICRVSATDTGAVLSAISRARARAAGNRSSAACNRPHQPAAQRLVSRENAAGKAPFQRLRHAHDTRQEPRARGFRHNPAPREHEAEPRRLAGQADIHGQLHGHADPHGRTVHGRDHRLQAAEKCAASLCRRRRGWRGRPDPWRLLAPRGRTSRRQPKDRRRHRTRGPAPVTITTRMASSASERSKASISFMRHCVGETRSACPGGSASGSECRRQRP